MSTAGLTTTGCLRETSNRLTDAAAIARAAVKGPKSGSEWEPVRVATDLDEILSETTALHGAVCLLGRMDLEASRAAPA